MKWNEKPRDIFESISGVIQEEIVNHKFNLFPSDHSMYLNHSNRVSIVKMNHLFWRWSVLGKSNRVTLIKEKSMISMCNLWRQLRAKILNMHIHDFTFSKQHMWKRNKDDKNRQHTSIFTWLIFLTGIGSRFSCHRLAVAKDWIISSGKQIITSGYSDNSVTGPASERNFDYLDSGRYITAWHVKSVSHRQPRRYYMQV